SAFGVAVSGSLAYVLHEAILGTSSLQIIDVSNPSSPVLRGTYAGLPGAQGLAISKSLAFVADSEVGLQIIDVSDPSAPQLRFEVFPVSGAGVTVSNSLAYLTADWGSSSGFSIFVFTDPSSPFEVGSITVPGEAAGVAVEGSWAYVAAGSAGLLVIDVSSRGAPVLVGSYDTPGDATGVAVEDSLVYVADGFAGLAIIDVSVPAAPVLVGAYNTEGDARAVEVSGALAYVADGDGGMVILRYAPSADNAVWRLAWQLYE
ncbi:hypothetical protein IIC65_09700, partial [Candidatus Sumerlaeota bacterium]|nr:hypothetical protein [Candidatus Sumerlaeota bacterium]